MRMRGLVAWQALSIAAGGLGACASLGVPGQLTPVARDQAIQQASFDHRCPPGKIDVLRHSRDSRTLELDVCGVTRRYQAVGGAWVEVGSNAGSNPVREGQ